jgi:hypothetical protein
VVSGSTGKWRLKETLFDLPELVLSLQSDFLPELLIRG